MIQVVLQGCRAGALAGAIWGALLLAFVSPIIQKAEVYESAAATSVASSESHVDSPKHHHHHHHHDGTPTESLSAASAQAVAPLSSATSEFEPNAWQRPLLTWLGAVFLGIAFGILTGLIYAIWLRLQPNKNQIHARPWLSGLGLGLGGFLVFQALPSIGLKPALPGVIGAEHDFSLRQSWWLLTVGCAGGAALLHALSNSFSRWARSSIVKRIGLALAGALLLYPFLGKGLPEIATASVTPQDLQVRFIWVSLGIGALFWLVLGQALSRLVYRECK